MLKKTRKKRPISPRVKRSAGAKWGRFPYLDTNAITAFYEKGLLTVYRQKMQVCLQIIHKVHKLFTWVF